jgi:hypothetical protein
MKSFSVHRKGFFLSPEKFTFAGMIVIDDILVSDEIRDIHFCCDLEKCKGACCVEGDAGAPLDEAEISELEDYIDRIKPYMHKDGIRVVEKSGVFDYDMNGEYVTPLIADKDCAFIYYEKDIARCAIEKAFEENKIGFRKPLSCHLYPIRIKKFTETEAVNYHKWHICQPACSKGKELNLTLYKFLKEPLIRKFGKDWYNKLVNEIEG